MKFSVYPITNINKSAYAAMRNSPFDKRFFKLGLLAIITVAAYWICSAKVETSERILPAEAIVVIGK